MHSILNHYSIGLVANSLLLSKVYHELRVVPASPTIESRAMAVKKVVREYLVSLRPDVARSTLRLTRKFGGVGLRPPSASDFSATWLPDFGIVDSVTRHLAWPARIRQVFYAVSKDSSPVTLVFPPIMDMGLLKSLMGNTSVKRDWTRNLLINVPSQKPRQILKEKFRPIQLKEDPWIFQPSIKKILKSSASTIGTLDYTVKFKDGQIKKVPSKELKLKYSTLIRQFEALNPKNSSTRLPRSTRSTTTKTTAKAAATTTKATQTRNYNRRLILEDDDDSDEYLDELDSDSEMSSEHVSESSDESTSSNRQTSRGRLLVKPRLFQSEFYPTDQQEERLPKKPTSVYVKPYTDDLFLKYHSEYCLRCYKTGFASVNATPSGHVDIGLQARRMRLLLCETCSVAMHNNCVSYHKQIDKATENLKCPKCVRGANCSHCETSILKKRGTAITPFRCVTCNTSYHHDCIIPGTSSELREKMKAADMVDVYRNGQCMECATFLKDRKPQTVAAERKVDGRLEYFVKWKDLSYRHANWVSAKWIANYSPTLHRGYIKRKEKEGIVSLSEDIVCIDRILDVVWADKAQKKAEKVLAVFKDTEYADAVWDEPPPKDDERLYEDYENALNRYIQASKVTPPKNMRSLIANVRSAATSESYDSREMKAQPDFIKGGTLMKHQIEALNWLIYQWEKSQPCILADDMGLGKTIQIISFLYYLYRKFVIYPFLIVVPNSTATNWVREFNKWAPELIVAPYFGLAPARKLALDNEIFDSRGQIKCHVVIATYESSCETSRLHDVFWPVLIVDESQRLKNDESLLFKTLARLKVDHIVLLTGTPLQNRLRELFNIMHFIRPNEFQGNEADHYEEMTKPQIEELHSRLKPYFLRRTKQEVLKKLPPKYELIVPVSMTPLQKEVYKLCLSKEIVETLTEATGTKRQKGLSNIFANLRKTLNHPYLLAGVELEQPTAEDVQKSMIEACGKLKLFHQMLPKILEQGHRILLFSTMTRNLDIIEDYLDYELVKYVRIDGSTKETNRVKAIDAFNAPNSKISIFLLSTRAGGVGINLATADTVIIWDSDFNPYADLQAISRAHRIGQANMVIIYRLMTRFSVEEKVLQIGKKKMALEHVVVERMKAEEEEQIEDLESILKFGTEALFDNDDSKDIRYDENAIDNLLDREQYREAATELQIKEVEKLEGIEKDQNMNFSYAKVWRADGTTEDLEVSDTTAQNESDFWEKFLAEQQAQKEQKKREKREAELRMGRGGRKRTAVSYAESNTHKSTLAEKEDKPTADEEFVLYHESESEDEGIDENHAAQKTDAMAAKPLTFKTQTPQSMASAKKAKLENGEQRPPRRQRRTKKEIEAAIRALMTPEQQKEQLENMRRAHEAQAAQAAQVAQAAQTVQLQHHQTLHLTEWEWIIPSKYQEQLWNTIVLPGILDVINIYKVQHPTTLNAPTRQYVDQKNARLIQMWQEVHRFSKENMDQEYIQELKHGMPQLVATDRFHLKFAFYNEKFNNTLHQVIHGYLNFYENDVYYQIRNRELQLLITDPRMREEQLENLTQSHNEKRKELNMLASFATDTFNSYFEHKISLRPKPTFSSIAPAPAPDASSPAPVVSTSTVATPAPVVSPSTMATPALVVSPSSLATPAPATINAAALNSPSIVNQNQQQQQQQQQIPFLQEARPLNTAAPSIYNNNGSQFQ
ncbi:hypothetical protein [Parasitella parasitica]|uniref:Uncharacterized protein n=1 Tax=Parasitella parasitica TaxID=35722 RepID=A0A0B7MNZ6_9FUNG|nr:hypothetical protein [Parasitella parasitica]